MSPTIGVCQFYQYGKETSPYLTKANDKPLWKNLVRGTPYYFSNAEIKPCDWLKRRHMVNFEVSHWLRALLVFCHIWVGFVKSGILPIYDKPWWQNPRFATLTLTVPQYIGAHIWKIPGFCQIWVRFVISGWDLSYMGGFVIYGWGLSNMGSYILRYRQS